MNRNQFERKHILVFGDVMLDQYIFGTVRGVSPEADVPIIDYSHRHSALGGAANVALNIVSLGGQATLLGIIGGDRSGESLCQYVDAQESIQNLMFTSSDRRTTSKTRIIADDQHVLRFDEEDRHELTSQEFQAVEEAFAQMEQQKPDAIILQDYNKGVLTPQSIEYAIQWARDRDIPVLVDPKTKHIKHYNGATLFKPNIKELSQIIGRDIHDQSEIQDAIDALRTMVDVDHVLVTMGAEGSVSSSAKGLMVHHPSRTIDLVDVCGAGDAVIATLAMSLANKLTLEDSARLANIAGSICCEHLGVHAVNAEDLWKVSEN